MPGPTTALDKRKPLDAMDGRPQKAARKWYRAQYVDIAIQTDFALADDAPMNSGTVSNVADTTPKILVTSTTTSNDSPTVGFSAVPRACIEQRTDVAPFTASPKDSAPTLIVSPSRAASHMKAADTFAPALSAPVLAMSSSQWMPSAAVTGVVGEATSAVPFLSTSAPVSLPSATCTPSHDVHNAPALTSRLSGPTLPSCAWTMLAVSSEFSHSDVRSFISGPILATPSTPTTAVLSHSSRSPPHGEEKPFPVPPASESLDRMNRQRRIWGKEPHHDSDDDVFMRLLTNSPSPKRLGMKTTPGQLPSASPGPFPSASPEPGPCEQAGVTFKRKRRAGKHEREKKEKYRLKQLQSSSKVDIAEEQPESGAALQE
ncbi:hypothetical protein EXIGLDRAFT_734977 [Exidia glandulosa HHB12029]|uniref:Uncharacterized protein n=1 Tax=Exidia glandulosa HHB12029 TaxID=1314781 RepID=A0A165Z585_EXIGL|nr:hypothetical protein EXIGLDRAFT_734977 [Exidia glandulosa HHB12029]